MPEDPQVDDDRHSPSLKQPAIRDSIAAQMMGAVLSTLMRQGGFASLLIIALVPERSELAIGLAFLVMQWSMLARVFAAPFVDLTSRQQFLVRWGKIAAGCSALLLAAPLVAWLGRPDLALPAFLFALAAYFITLQVGLTAWFPLLHVIVPESLRGRYFGTMRRAWQLTGFAAVAICGLVLGQDPDFGRFALVLIPVILLQIGRVVMYSRLPDPPPSRTASETPSWRDVLVPLRDRPFVEFVLLALLFTVVQQAAVPFVVPFLKTELGFPASTTLYGTACFGLGSALALVTWGRLADAWGTRLVFALGSVAGAAGAGIIAATPPYRTDPVTAAICAVSGLALSGVGASGIGIAYTVRLMRAAPPDRMGSYFNVSQVAVGVTIGLGTAVAGAALRWLPAAVQVAGLQIPTFRLFFLAVGAGLLLLLPLLRRLPRLTRSDTRGDVLRGVLARRRPGSD